MKRLMIMITTVFSLLFLLYSVTFSLTTNHVIFNAVNEETKNNMLGTAATLRPMFRLVTADDMASENEKWQATTQEIATVLNPNERVVIYDHNRQQHYAYGNMKLVDVKPTREDFVRAGQIGTNTQVETGEDDRLRFSYVEKIYNGRNETIGYIQISRFITDITDIQKRLMYFGLGASVLAIITLLAVLMVYFRRMALPIQAIKRQLDHLSAGQYDMSYQPVRIAEFDTIGATINTLSKDLQQQEQELLMQDDRLRLMVNSMVLGMILIGSDHRVLLANPAVSRILGLETPLVGKDYPSILTSYRLIRLIEKSFAQHRHIHEEVYVYHPEEMVLDVNVIFVDDHDIQESKEQVIVLIYDITATRRLEKVRTDFIANASHELKTPVTALQGFSETLLDGALEDPETARRFVEIINKESTRLNHLISDILDLAKIEQDQLSEELEWVTLDDVISEVLQQVQIKADKKPIYLTHINQHQESITFYSVRGKVYQILSNLITNAINYTNPEGEVIIATKVVNQAIEIRVIDNGIGIPAKDLPRIFERFYRVNKSRSTSTGGTGLGLAIVRNLVEALGGRIDVQSQLGEGTEFCVVLPNHEKSR